MQKKLCLLQTFKTNMRGWCRTGKKEKEEKKFWQQIERRNQENEKEENFNLRIWIWGRRRTGRQFHCRRWPGRVRVRIGFWKWFCIWFWFWFWGGRSGSGCQAKEEVTQVNIMYFFNFTVLDGNIKQTGSVILQLVPVWKNC